MRLPNATPAYSQQDQANMRSELTNADALNVKRNVAEAAIPLQSPNGTVYMLSVSDLGILVVTAY